MDYKNGFVCGMDPDEIGIFYIPALRRNKMATKINLQEMSEQDIVDAYRKIVGENDVVSRESPYDEYGNYKKVSFLKEADVHYLLNSCDMVEV